MALDKLVLKNKIASLLQDMMTREQTSIDEFAERLSNAVDDYVKQGDIIYTDGLTAPNGPVTGTFNGNLQ
ncbi:MAG: hypothetical protein KKC03_06115 [Bacteroidetes bacterium]|nr:hypothetical protein [Bacteroidota bacterium]